MDSVDFDLPTDEPAASSSDPHYRAENFDVDESIGYLVKRVRSMLSHAIEREDRNWQWYYLRSRVEHEAGEAKA